MADPLNLNSQAYSAKHTTPHDHLGTNASQYATKIYEPYLVPFLLSLDLTIEEILVMNPTWFHFYSH
ncbi:hypothetical protein L873DRAFT_1817406 [Choiromyces venosus 120613-1]|uniref:Uncharacterized protein n=1 Tax=Choiromyces venosus 120613-1 TaxID=1336337 RepID=A0A3N4J303_9PEZI|nr:hypothetical protein L873DRAFT_1817406 [Choiromyces venosus 120613-1]